MIHTINLYYFSPTGGTKKVAETFCTAIAEKVNLIDLGIKNEESETLDADLTVLAAPVFTGRIPALAAERFHSLNLDGAGKRAVTLAVYGTRAYEDALVELNDVVSESGFEVMAAGAFVAQHSIVPEVGTGRPNEKDITEIRSFAEKVAEKLEHGPAGEKYHSIEVPGNRPYKAAKKMPAAPFSLPDCNHCGKCERICPTAAISVNAEGVMTNQEECILCMACVYACPKHVRVLPAPLQEGTNQKLAAFKTVYRENEWYL